MTNNASNKNNNEEEEIFFNGKFLKLLSIVYAIGAPWFIWATVEIFAMKSDIRLMTVKVDVIGEIHKDIKEIRNDINNIKLDLAKNTK
jgi:hypothetical protein